jgi:hypothetical protein
MENPKFLRPNYVPQQPTLEDGKAPIRYGVIDIFATLVLFAVHLAVIKSYLIQVGHIDNQTVRVFAAAAIAAAFAFGAAYLSFRFATKYRVAAQGWRLVCLVAMDLFLILIPGAVFWMIEFWPAVVLALAFLLIEAIPLCWRSRTSELPSLPVTRATRARQQAENCDVSSDS